MRCHAVRVLAVITLLALPTVTYAQNVTVSGTVSFSSLDGGPDDADHTANGVFTVNGDLTVNGTINCNDTSSTSACPMTFAVGGNTTLAAGSQVFAENRSNDGNGGNITFNTTGNFTMQGPALTLAGALVSSSKLNAGTTFHAGDITVNAGGTVTQQAGAVMAAAANDCQAGAISVTGGGQVSIGGMLLSGPTRTISTSTIYTGVIMSGGGGHVVGGPITVKSLTQSEPAVSVGPAAIIAGQGGDVGTAGANTVAIEGCNVQINGLVASIARRLLGPRVVVRSGTTITVDASSLGTTGGVHYGVLRADATREDATTYHVDLYAAKDIIVVGAPATSGLFALTSNSGSTPGRVAGTVNVTSVGGTITASGNAFQASGNQGGDAGGNVNVSAKGNVTLAAAAIDASGSTSGSTRAGGHIAVRSYSGALTWTAGTGDVRPVGSTAGVPSGQQGTISLTYCTTLSTSGTSFPTNGSPVGIFPTTAQTCSPAAPSLPSGETLPACNTAPVANDTSATTNEDNSVTVTMTASDADGNPMTFSIVTPPAHGNLGPIFNQTSTSAQVTYTPNANYNGSDSFTFQADDGQGGTDTGVVTITINPVNDPPTFNLGANPVSSNEDAGAQSLANYASSISPGPTADEQTQTVTFTVTNDNNALFSAQPAISSSGTLTYTSAPNANGSANVTVVAHDSGGTANGGNDTSSTHNFNIIINAVNDAPSFTKGADQTVAEDSGPHTVSAWASGISAGPADEAGQTVTFSVTNDNNALFSAQPAVDSAGNLTFTSAPDASGVATVTVVAHDSGGTANGGVDTSAPQTFTITVTAVNDAPVAVGDSYVTSEDTTLTVNAASGVLANDTDVDTPHGSLTAILVSGPSNASAFALNADGSFSYTPNADFNGSDSFTYKANDGSLDSNTVTVNLTVTAVNDAPAITRPASVTTNEDTTFTFNGGATISVADVDGGAGSETVTLSAANGTLLLSSTAGLVVTGNGTSFVVASGTLTNLNNALSGLQYTPNANFNGADTLAIGANDNGNTGSGGPQTDSKSVSITVNAVNDAPVAAPDSYTTDEDTPLTVNTASGVLANDSDVDTPHGSLTAILVSGPSNASAFALNADGSFSYTPNANFNGSDAFTYKANDGSLDSNTVTVSITVNAVNDAPVNSMPAPPSVPQDTTLTMSGAGAIQISDIDAGANAVQVSLTATNGTMSLSGTAGLSFSVGDGTADASMTFTGTIADINSALNGMTFVPTPSYYGPASIQIVTNDLGFTGSGGPLTDSDTLSITVQQSDQPPVNSVPGPQSVNEDTPLVFSSGNGNAISTSDPDSTGPVQVSLSVTNGTLTLGGTAGLSFTVGDGTADASMTFTGSIASINAALNGMSYTGNANYSGSDVLTITTNDQENVIPGGPLSDTDTVNITINPVDDAPVAVADGPYSVYKYTATSNTSLNVNAASGVLANDTDIDTPHSSLTAVLVSGPSHAQSFVLNSDGSFTYVPATGYVGSDAFSYKANDGTSDSNTVSAGITVLNHAPSGTSDSYTGVGNTALDVASPANPANDTTPSVHLAGNLLTNDTDADGDTLAAVAETVATTAGGSATISANGSFTYSPVANATSDTFTYHVTDGTDTAPVTVTLTFNNKVWYVKNDVAGSGTGTSTDPFQTLASAQTASAPGEYIYVFVGDGTTANMTAGITLKNNQSLIGAGAELVVNANTLVTAGATRPRITNTAGNAVDTANGNSVKGVVLTGASSSGLVANGSNGLTVDRVTIENNTVAGLILSTTSGTINVTNTTMSGNANTLSIFGGTSTITIDNTNSIGSSGNNSIAISSRPAAAGNVTIGATINDTRPISITNNASGTISFTGTQTLSTGITDAVTLSNNSGATINFSGALGITTTVGGALIATGGGTLNVTGTANVTTGPAVAGVNINGVTAGASGITFTSVTTSGAGTGVSLASLGNGNVAINGGTIDAGVTGISLSSLGTSTVTLAGLSIGSTAPPSTAISGSSFGTLAISGSAVNVKGGTALSLSSGSVTGTFNNVTSTGGTNGVNLSNVHGSWGATTGTLSGATGTTFNISGASGNITWGGTISQSNAANVMTIASSNSDTLVFNGGITSSGASTGLSIGGSSGSYNFNGTNSFSGSTGITLGAGGESGSVVFSSATTITASGTAFLVDGTSGNVTAAITYQGTIDKATTPSGGIMISVNKLVSPGSLTMSRPAPAAGDLKQSQITARGISVTNSSGAIVINNASITHQNTQEAVTLSNNTGASITLLGLSVTSNGNKASMLLSGGGTITVSVGAASPSLNGLGGTARVIDGATTTFTGILNLTNVTITGNAAGGVFLTGSTLGGTGSTITGSGSGLTLSTVTLTNGAGMTSVTSTGGANGISLTNVTGGPYTVAGGSLSGNSGSTFLVSGGTTNFTYNGTLSQTNAQRIVNISGLTGGAITLGGNVTGTASATGISVAGLGGTVSLGGVLSLNGANDTFTASGSGLTVTAPGTTNTIGNTAAPVGPAVSITNATIGAAGVRFQKVSSNGGVNGIALTNTGSSGSFTISGNGGTCTSSATCTGGAITNATGAGISMNNTTSPSFDRIFIQNTGKSGISGTLVNNFTLTNSTIDNSGTDLVSATDDSNVGFGFSTGGSPTDQNVTGTIVITGNRLTNAFQHGIDIQNYAGTIADAQIQNNIITSSTLATSSNGSGIRLLGFGSAGGVSSITKAEITGNTITNFPSGGGISAQFGNPTGPSSTWGTPGSANAILIQNNHIAGDATTKMNTNAILGTLTGNGNAYWKIDGNGTVASPITNMKGAAIGVTTRCSSAITCNSQADITNNVIVANNILGSQGIAVGITNVAGATTDAPQLDANIIGNSVSATSGIGIDALANACSGLLTVKIQNNTVGMPTGAGTFAIEPRQGGTPAGGAPALCLNISGNAAAGNAVTGIGIRKQSGQTWAYGVDSLPAGSTATPNFEAYINSLNPAGGGTTLLSATSGFTSCSNP